MGRNYCADRVQVKTSEKLNIGFVRRGFSPTGGAEAYLRRVAGAVAAAGHEATLFTTKDWPEKEWTSGRIIRIGEEAPIAFADESDRMKSRCYFLARAGNERDCVSPSLRSRSCATSKCGCWWLVAGTSANIAPGV